jgi:hypothetical protein
MAAGDPQRVWFPEMLARLRCEWKSQMSFPALIELRDRLDAMLQMWGRSLPLRGGAGRVS